MLASTDLEMVDAVFFDLDGTLVDVDMNLFVPGYLRRLTGQLRELSDPAAISRCLHHAVAAMFANRDAAKTLETVLYEVLFEDLQITAEEYRKALDGFCQAGLSELRPLVSGHSLSLRLVDVCLDRGWRVVLATNPIFPRAVVDARIMWGELDGDKFHHVTAYETAHFCKPNPAFFAETLDMLGLDAKRCLMVGNDTLHDMAAGQVGMQTCLLTPWSIRRPGAHFKPDWQGTHEDLLALLCEDSPSALP